MEPTKVDGVADRELARMAALAARVEAFQSLADRHLDASYRLAQAILGQRAEAEDATHDAFESAWRNWSALRDTALFERWFDRILINTCRNRLRHPSRRRTQELGPASEGVGSDAYGPTHERALLAPALASLTPDQRVVLALRFYRDLSVDEIASRMKVRPGTVKSRLHRGLRELRKALDKTDPERTLR